MKIFIWDDRSYKLIESDEEYDTKEWCIVHKLFVRWNVSVFKKSQIFSTISLFLLHGVFILTLIHIKNQVNEFLLETKMFVPSEIIRIFSIF